MAYTRNSTFTSMKNIKSIIKRISCKVILFSLLNIMSLNAQKSTNTMEDNKALSKDELIKTAKKLLKQKYPEINLNFNDFDTRAWKNDRGFNVVIFNRKIRYITDQTDQISYNVTINIDRKEIMPFDNPDITFYTSSKKAEKTIKQLKTKGFLPKNSHPDIEYTITENENYYLISCFDNLHDVDKRFINKEHPYLSKTIIDKKTGETLFLKGRNPFYYLTLITFKEYYNKSLYAILQDEDKSNKNEIIKIASSILKEKQPNLKLNPDDYEIMILGNYKDVIVKYRRLFRFNKPNKKTAFDLAVNIISKEISPFDSSGNSFYTPSAVDKKIINTIQNITPLHVNNNEEYTISENEDYYYISCVSQKQIKKYLIDRKTNKIITLEDSSNNLLMYNREDLSLQEHYKRWNGFFSIDNTIPKPVIDLAKQILKEKVLTPNINFDNYNIICKASKDEVIVKFKSLYKFIPLRQKNKLKHTFAINVLTKNLIQKPSKLYFPSKEDTEIIDIIKSKFPKESLLVRSYGLTQEYFPIDIVEKKKFYEILTRDSYKMRKQRIEYRLSKKSKKIKTIKLPKSIIRINPASMPIKPIEYKN